MKILKNKVTTMAIIILFLLSMSVSITLTQITSAHTPPYQIPTYAFLSISPNLVGVGQTINVNMWINFVPPTAGTLFGDRWQNFKVDVIKPDGTNETLGPFSSDDAGSKHTTYSPSTPGNYTFVFYFPGQTIAGANPPPGGFSSSVAATIGDYYQPSTSDPVTITVQDAPVPGYPSNPLPTQYWERPINSMNTDWYQLGGNWLGLKSNFGGSTGQYNVASNFNPYSQAPNTAHVLWTKPVAEGGMMGGEFGGTEQSSYYATSQYENKFSPVIINGILYYTFYPGSSTSPAGTVAVDLRTGKTLWTSDLMRTLPDSRLPQSTSSEGPTTVLKCGQILNYVTPNQFGGLTYLWTTGTPVEVAKATNIRSGSTTWNMFDALTGNYILSLVNGTAVGGLGGSALTEDEGGNLIGYYVTSSRLYQWNSTWAIINYCNATGFNTNLWAWRPPQGAIIPFDYGVQWSVTIPTTITQNGVTGTISPAMTISTGVSQIVDGVVIINNVGNGAWQPGWTAEAGFSATDGALLYLKNQTQSPWTSILPGAAGNGVYTEYTRESQSWSGYSLTTGQKVWGPIKPVEDSWSFYDWWSSIAAYGNLYVWTLGGHVYALNITTGVVQWIWQTQSSGYETTYGNWPIWVFNDGVMGDGKLYVCGGHEYNPPVFKGAKLYCLNATTGTEIFETLGFDVGGPPAIADGQLVVKNSYDNQIYAYGVGPSKITVNAPNAAVTTTGPFTITGRVTDISAGASQSAVAANFPNGLPVVSDDSMSQFMEAVYQQQSMPNNITGVPVALSVLDSNGNYRTIGTATTNALGDFSFAWTPDIPGDFTVYATFAGTQSYYGSTASTGMHAGVPAATPAPTQAPIQSMADQYFLPSVAAIIVVIIIGFAVLALLMLRKKP